MLTDENVQLTPLVNSVMQIDDITTGDAKQNYLVRYRGRLRGDSAEAYDQLAACLRPLDITPLFRIEDKQHVILLMAGTLNPRPSNPWINLIMFVLTLFSVLFAGALYNYSGSATTLSGYFLSGLQNLGSGIPFAVSLLAILLAHEFGHYVAGRIHNTHVTLPYFIPFPFSYFGTMGAFIQLKEPPKNKRILLDIGIAGPLAGLAVAIPVLIVGLSLSHLSQLPSQAGSGLQMEGNSLLYLISKYLIFGHWLPQPANFGSLSPFVYWVRYFFTGQPMPLGGLDVQLNAIAWAGWAGLLVTALNLIPAGQFDGGHVIYVIFGRRARLLMPFILAILVLLGFFWAGWWLWAFLILILGRIYAEPLDQITQLDPPRKAVALIGLVVFILVFTPVPLMI